MSDIKKPKTKAEAEQRERSDAAKADKLRSRASAPYGAVPEEMTEFVEGPQSLLTGRGKMPRGKNRGNY